MLPSMTSLEFRAGRQFSPGDHPEPPTGCGDFHHSFGPHQFKWEGNTGTDFSAGFPAAFARRMGYATLILSSTTWSRTARTERSGVRTLQFAGTSRPSTASWPG